MRGPQPLAVRFLPKLGRESSHGLFLPPVCRPNALYRGSIAGRKTGWQQRAGSSVAGWGKCRRDKMPWPGGHATVAMGAPRRLRYFIHALKMQQNTES